MTSLALDNPEITNNQILATDPASLLPSLSASDGTQNSSLHDYLGLNPDPVAVLKAAKIDGSARRFGNPPAASCSEVVQLLPHDIPTILTDPKRSYGPCDAGDFDVPLPRRWLSCKFC